jgi:hypothetical protein
LEQQGDYAQAIEFHEKAQELFIGLGNDYSLALVVANLGKAWANLDITRSNQLLKEAITNLRELGAEEEANTAMKWLIRNMT